MVRPAENLHSLIALSQLTIVPRFQWDGMLSQTGLQCEYANNENGLWKLTKNTWVVPFLWCKKGRNYKIRFSFCTVYHFIVLAQNVFCLLFCFVFCFVCFVFVFSLFFSIFIPLYLSQVGRGKKHTDMVHQTPSSNNSMMYSSPPLGN